ncbi:HesA/MoeB/ThiF family protein [Streptomyces marispadix]|uniref:ThiF family adenylyltransferase n=1 Tax=Streptomyces marispadix TaxID=2922868 RepID=A0ABS9SZX9_9ACTN|nr:ThiF family adenylyltransferase [Streptomyces marispadix]MCH6161601.1 ThiF family adenylyltransferase [Streptomyces marispadix]
MGPVRLVESVRCVREDGGVLLVRGREALRVSVRAGRTGEFVEALRGGTTVEALGSIAAPERVRALFGKLDSLGWLTGEEAHSEQAVPWDRQVGWFTALTPDAQAAQRRLCGSEVGILGVGGIGGPAAQHLAAAGVPRLWLIDHDRVAVHNLNRQYLFGSEDIGRPKTEAAADALRRLVPEVEVRTVDRRVSGTADLDALPASLDLLLLAADRPRTIGETAWEWARATGTALLGGAVGLDTGCWGPLLDPAQGHCLHCFEARRSARFSSVERELESRSDPTPYSFGPTNALIAAFVARDALLYLGTGRCESQGRRVVMDVLGIGGRREEATADEARCERPGGEGHSGGGPSPGSAPAAAAPAAADAAQAPAARTAMTPAPATTNGTGRHA